MASLLFGMGAPPMAPTSLSFSKSQSLIQSPFSLSASAASLSTPSLPFIYCGRGDKKTARGKRFNHSFGNARPRNKKKGRGPPRVPAPPLPPRKDKYEDGQVIKVEIEE